MRLHLLLLSCLFIVSACSSTGKTDKAPSPDATAVPPAASEIYADYEDTGYDHEDDDDAFFAEMESEYGGEAARVIADPLETFNRGLFVFNDKMYFWVLKPVATGWKKVVPAPARTGLGNFFRNLGAPVRIANNLLQFKLKSAGSETGKFIVNSIWGLGGFIEVSESIPTIHNTPEEDLGQTFGRWGIGNGFYIVLPFLGPSTLRDGIGRIGDGVMNPVSYAGWDWEVYAALYGIDAVNATSMRLGDYETMKAAALDPYTVVRDGYVRLRTKEVAK